MFDWLEWLQSAHMHSERRKGGSSECVPGQSFALARMLPIISRGQALQLCVLY